MREIKDGHRVYYVLDANRAFETPPERPTEEQLVWARKDKTIGGQSSAPKRRFGQFRINPRDFDE